MPVWFRDFGDRFSLISKFLGRKKEFYTDTVNLCRQAKNIEINGIILG
jgi:hypothetical protein